MHKITYVMAQYYSIKTLLFMMPAQPFNFQGHVFFFGWSVVAFSQWESNYWEYFCKRFLVIDMLKYFRCF